MSTIAVMYIGKKLKAQRIKRFMTQEQFAPLVGLSRDHLGRIERNEHEPHFSTIQKIAERLEIEPAELVDEG
jgi:transcriptional regulator with XRE-family HTH domain